MVLLAVAVYRIWRKNGPVMLAMAKVPDNAKWANYHILWFRAAILLPLGLALAALSGYYYTVAFLTGKAGETLWFLIILVLLKDLLLRDSMSRSAACVSRRRCATAKNRLRNAPRRRTCCQP